jgi:hypothetical protein
VIYQILNVSLIFAIAFLLTSFINKTWEIAVKQPLCEVIGCSQTAVWRLLVSDNPNAEDYLCDHHWKMLHKHKSCQTASYALIQGQVDNTEPLSEKEDEKVASTEDSFCPSDLA